MATEELYSLLIPLADSRLIVPRACVAEVVGYSPMPEEDEARAGRPDWYLGKVRWSGREVPVISFEALAGGEAPVAMGRSRVVILLSLAGQLEAGYFGLLTRGFPQLVRVNAAVLEADTGEKFEEQGPVICQVTMVNQHPLIPDLEYVEAQIASAGLQESTLA